MDLSVNPITQRRFNDGHRFERLARPLACEIIGADLFPSTVSISISGLTRRLSASLDGVTMDDTTTWEHKTLSMELAAALDQGIIPEKYHWQIEQGMLITGATRCLFMASKWDDNDVLIDEKHCWYESRPSLQASIVPTWKQIEEDAANYKPIEAAPEAVSAPILNLPSINLQVSGQIAVIDNFAAFESALRDFVDNKLIRKPESDQDFANLDTQIKTLKRAEESLKSEEARIFSQVESIDIAKRSIDMLYKLSRDNRLMAEKLLETEKVNRRRAIQETGEKALRSHIESLNKRIGRNYMPVVVSDFPGVMRGKKAISSLRDACDGELARCKIEANATADRVSLNLTWFNDYAKGFEFLFPDLAQIIML